MMFMSLENATSSNARGAKLRSNLLNRIVRRSARNRFNEDSASSKEDKRIRTQSALRVLSLIGSRVLFVLAIPFLLPLLLAVAIMWICKTVTEENPKNSSPKKEVTSEVLSWQNDMEYVDRF